MLTFTQLRKFDSTPADKSIVRLGSDRLYDAGEYWSNGFAAFREPLPTYKGQPIEPTGTVKDFSSVLSDAAACDRQVWPVRIVPGPGGTRAPRSITRLDGISGDSLWINTKYILASVKKKRSATTFWANGSASKPIVCKDDAGNIVSILMPMHNGHRVPIDNDPDWSLQNLDLPAAC